MKDVPERRGSRVLAIVLAMVLQGCAHVDRRPPPAPAPAAPAPAPVPVAPAPAPAPAAAAPAPVVEKVSFAMDMFFEPREYEIRPAHKARLDELVARLSDVDLDLVVAVGHTDATGSDGRNKKLSVLRAEAVKSYLVSRGLDMQRVYTEGAGESQPVADNKTAEGRARNNRVEIEVSGVRGRGASGAPDTTWRNDLVPVLFATNRQRTGSDNPFYFYGNRMTDERDSQNLARGMAVIKVPKMRQRGTVDRPGWVRVVLERITHHPLASAAGIRPVEAADVRTQFSYAQKIEELTAADFAAELKTAVSRSKSKTAVLYVHGYANDFTDAAFRTAQIVFDLTTPSYDLVPLMFSWPSDAGLTGMDYDEARRRSQASGYDLARFLKEIAANTDIGTVHLIAHSMGAEVLGHAMVKLGINEMGVGQADGPMRPLFRRIVFAAPDVTPRIFEDVIEPALRTNHSITTYGATVDLPLWLSTMKNRQARTGLVASGARLAACVDTIDVTAVAQKGLAHSTWAETPRVLDDLRLVLRDGLAPSMRGLRKRRLLERTVWTLPVKAVAMAAHHSPSPSPAANCVLP